MKPKNVRLSEYKIAWIVRIVKTRSLMTLAVQAAKFHFTILPT